MILPAITLYLDIPESIDIILDDNEIDVEFDDVIVLRTGETTDYIILRNKPKINNVTLVGNISCDNLGLISKKQGSENQGKILKVNSEGDLELSNFYSIVSNPAGGNTLIL